MTSNEIGPERRVELLGKYIDIDPKNPPAWLADYAARLGADAQTALAAIRSEAEQHVLSAMEVRRACEDYNRDNGCGWITWELTPELRERINQARARQREAHRRDTEFGESILRYDDDRNSGDEQNGWPAYDPDDPHHQGVPLGIIVAQPDTVHVLRAGTPASADLPDYGRAYDPATFFRHAEQQRKRLTRRYVFPTTCDLWLPNGCGADRGMPAMDTRLIAIPDGTHIYMLNVCGPCGDVIAQSFRAAHPDVPTGNVRKTKAGQVVAIREPGEPIPDWQDWTGGLDGKGVPPQ